MKLKRRTLSTKPCEKNRRAVFIKILKTINRTMFYTKCLKNNNLLINYKYSYFIPTKKPVSRRRLVINYNCISRLCRTPYESFKPPLLQVGVCRNDLVCPHCQLSMGLVIPVSIKTPFYSIKVKTYDQFEQRSLYVYTIPRPD